ncbi:hypothetical protein BH11GEM1_BH11GEM1_06680 [soil metagenome]
MVPRFTLPQPWKDRGWKLKIRDRERVEPPHVSLLWRTQCWRYGLRVPGFLDREPDASLVPAGVVEHLEIHIEQYVIAWNLLYPENPVITASERESASGDDN